jgi:hypothetical protein
VADGHVGHACGVFPIDRSEGGRRQDRLGFVFRPSGSGGNCTFLPLYLNAHAKSSWVEARHCKAVKIRHNLVVPYIDINRGEGKL